MKQKLCLNCGAPVENPANDLCDSCGAAALAVWEDSAPSITRDRKKIAEILRERRKELGYTQKQLAAMTGMEQAAISRIERGKIFISTKLLLLLLDALELKIIFADRSAGEEIIVRK